ncbi:MAG: hypothetical protein IJF54_04240 [Clostridia bacterium]|nr:hypothetical protein [Clostridia bacterium]
MGSNKILNQALSLFIKLIMVDVVCFIMGFFVLGITQNSTVRVLIQALQIFCLIAVIYSQCYESGEKDSVLVNSGSKKSMPLKGLYVGIIATAPFLVSGIGLVIAKMFFASSNYVNIYRMINMFYFPFNMSIMPPDMKMKAIGWGAVVLSLLTLLIIPAFCMFSYMLGKVRFSFKETLFYKKADQE